MWCVGSAGRASGFYSFCPLLPPLKAASDTPFVFFEAAENFAPSKGLASAVPKGLDEADWDPGQELVNVETVPGGLQLLRKEVAARDQAKAHRLVLSNFSDVKGQFEAAEDKAAAQAQLRGELDVLRRHLENLRPEVRKGEAQMRDYDALIARLNRDNAGREEFIEEIETTEPLMLGIKKTKKKKRAAQGSAVAE